MWIFPEKCVICGCEIDEKFVFCSKCFTELNFIDFPICECCGKPIEILLEKKQICKLCSEIERNFDSCRSLLIYDFVSKKLVMKIKKNADNYVAKKIISILISKYKYSIENFDIIIPVPTHFSRALKRGYNPSAIIAQQISDILKIPLKTDILKKNKKTEYQKNKTVPERISNVQNAFYCKKDLSNFKIILVDDVLTSGATLNECSKILKNAGAKSVFCLTLASTK